MSIDLDHLAALHEAATPGELVAQGSWVCFVVGECTCSGGVYGHEQGCGLEPLVDVGQPANAALIVAAVNALPELIERVREAEALSCEVKAALGKPTEATIKRHGVPVFIGLDYGHGIDGCDAPAQRARADAAESRLAALEAGIQALADAAVRTRLRESVGGHAVVTVDWLCGRTRALLTKGGE